MEGGQSRNAVVERQYDCATIAPSVAVVEALADLEKVDPTSLETRLNDYVDPDALDALVTRGKEMSVSFRLNDYRIRIESDELKIETV